MGAARTPILVAMLLSTAACGATKVAAPRGPVLATSTAPKPVQTSSVSAKSIAFISDYAHRDLFLYDVTANTTRQMTTDGTAGVEHLPRFRTSGRLTYTVGATGGDSIYEFNLAAGTGPTRVLFAKGKAIFDYAWSPDGKTVIYLTRNSKDNSGTAVWLKGPADSSPRVIRPLPDIVGRGTGDGDSFSISWSPDGTMILVNHTALDYGMKDGPSVFVLRTNGSPVVSPVIGTQAIWSAGGDAVFYRQYNRPARWYRLDIGTGKSAVLGMTPWSLRPSLSPDGRKIAYDLPDGANSKLFVFDLATGVESKIAKTGLISPVWLDADALAASDIGSCSVSECGDSPPWKIDGPAMRVTLDGGSTTLALGNTLDADVLYG